MKKFILMLSVVTLAFSMFSCLNPEKDAGNAALIAGAILTTTNGAAVSAGVNEGLDAIAEVFGKDVKKTITISDVTKGVNSNTFSINLKEYPAGSIILTGTIFVTAYKNEKAGFNIEAVGMAAKMSVQKKTYLGIHFKAQSKVSFGEGLDKSKVELTINGVGIK